MDLLHNRSETKLHHMQTLLIRLFLDPSGHQSALAHASLFPSCNSKRAGSRHRVIKPRTPARQSSDEPSRGTGGGWLFLNWKAKKCRMQPPSDPLRSSNAQNGGPEKLPAALRTWRLKP